MFENAVAFTLVCKCWRISAKTSHILIKISHSLDRPFINSVLKIDDRSTDNVSVWTTSMDCNSYVQSHKRQLKNVTNNVWLVRLMIKDGETVTHELFINACSTGQTKIVRLLLDLPLERVNTSLALRYASKKH